MAEFSALEFFFEWISGLGILQNFLEFSSFKIFFGRIFGCRIFLDKFLGSGVFSSGIFIVFFGIFALHDFFTAEFSALEFFLMSFVF